MKLQEAATIARLLGVPAEEVLENAGVKIHTGAVPITGFVDETGELHHQKLGTVPHPGPAYPDTLCAAQCRTAGTRLDYMDGWLIFAEKPRAEIAAESIGRMSWCKMRNGVIYLAQVRRGYQRGRWSLSGPVATAEDVELEWAVPVALIQP